MAEFPSSPEVHGKMAWLLASCPLLPFRDEARAVQIAKKGLTSNPSFGTLWRALGTALYRKGDWAGAIEALTNAISLEPTDGIAPLFLAMAYWQKGEKDQALSWHQKALRLKGDPTLWNMVRRFRAESAALLGVKPPDGDERSKPVGVREIASVPFFLPFFFFFFGAGGFGLPIASREIKSRAA